MNDILFNDILTMSQVPWSRQIDFHKQHNNPNKILLTSNLNTKKLMSLIGYYALKFFFAAYAHIIINSIYNLKPNRSLDLKTTTIKILGTTNKKTHISLS